MTRAHRPMPRPVPSGREVAADKASGPLDPAGNTVGRRLRAVGTGDGRSRGRPVKWCGRSWPGAVRTTARGVAGFPGERVQGSCEYGRGRVEVIDVQQQTLLRATHSSPSSFRLWTVVPAVDGAYPGRLRR